MKAVSYQRFGGTDVLQTVEEAQPAVQSNQVLVKIKAVSINPMDWKIRKGEMRLMSGSKFPRHTGGDFSGVVEAIGSAVGKFKKGDEVFGVVRNTMKDGALAQYIAVPSTLIWRKPALVSFTQAASIPIVGAAAVTAIEKMGDINRGTQILVNGATGGFGMFLLQLLKLKGANVTAVASTKGVATAKKWGAAVVIDYTNENVLSQKLVYDIIIDLSGKMGYSAARKIMKSNALFLNPTPTPVEIPLSIFKNIFRRKKHIVILSTPSPKNMDLLVNAIKAGLHVEVTKTFPFAESKKGYDYAEQGGVIGKVAFELN